MIPENSPLHKEPAFIRYKAKEQTLLHVSYFGYAISLVFVIFLSIATGSWWWLFLWLPMAVGCTYWFVTSLKTVEDSMRSAMTAAMLKHMPETVEALTNDKLG